MTQSQDTEELETYAHANAELAVLPGDAPDDNSRSNVVSDVAALDPQTPISKSSLPQLAGYVRRGAKPKPVWQCGVEFEVFGYTARNLERLNPEQIQRVLAGLAASSHATSRNANLILEDGTAIEALIDGGGRVTIEPGGQVEFSGAPHSSLSEIETDTRDFLERLHSVAGENDFVFLAAGFDPFRTLGEQQWFPKPRYSVMRPYLAAHGARAWDMMSRTCAVQVNLDYESDGDLAKKFVLGNRLAPYVAAIFANSPFADGVLSGYKSTRAAAWLETDDARAGVSPLAFQDVDCFSPEAFVEYALTVPMIFVRRDGGYANAVAGQPFGEFLLHGAGAIEPVFQDWTDHLTTIFTEARLKQYLEMRSADGGTLEMALALAALWRGLMYDDAALDEALRLAPKLQPKEMRALQAAVARDGLAAEEAGVNVLRVAKDLIALAADGLRRFAPAEGKYLDILREQVIEDEVCPADIQLRNWHGAAWHGSLQKLAQGLRVA
ncbi:MAG: glutamate--cysteine ligase [Pyrinomonadaceae bacterium]